MSSSRTIRERARKLAGGNREKRRLDWWNQPQDEAHKTIFEAGQRIRRRNMRRRREMLLHGCLYDDAELGLLASGMVSADWMRPASLSTNIVRRNVDTYVAMTAREKPLPLAQTDGANFHQQRRAERLSEVMQGALELSGYYDLLPVRRRDSAVYGDGFAINYRVGTKLFHERVYPWEVDVDPHSGTYGTPGELTITRYVDCDRLIARYGHADVIERSIQRDPDDMMPLGFDEEGNQRLVRMSWRLPDDRTPGRLAISVSEGVLYWAEYKWDTFPLSKLSFAPPLVGWYGDGMARQLVPLQLEVNSIGLKLSEAHYLTPAFYIYVSDESDIDVEPLDNLPGAVIKGRGAMAPQFITPQSAHPDLLNYYQQLRSNWSSEESGVNQLAQSGAKPAGLNSGKSLRIYKDMQSERFYPQGQLVEKDCIDTAWIQFRLLEEAYTEDKSLKISVPGRDGLQLIPWEQVRMDREEFVLKVRPINFFSTTPSARIEEAEEMVNGPFQLPPEEAIELLGFPDMDRFAKRKLAGRRAAESVVQRILDAEDPFDPKVRIRPEPPMDLAYTHELATQTYLDMRTKDGSREETMQALLELAVSAKAELDKLAPPPAPAPPMPPPGAPPMPGPADGGMMP